MAQIKNLSGGVIAAAPLSQVAAVLAEMSLSPDDVEVVLSPAEIRTSVRERIEKEVGDDKTLIGIISDNVQLLTVFMAAVITESSGSDDPVWKGVHEILQAMAGADDIVALAAHGLDQINTGEVVLTAAAKGVAVVWADGLEAPTKVVGVLSEV